MDSQEHAKAIPDKNAMPKADPPESVDDIGVGDLVYPSSYRRAFSSLSNFCLTVAITS
jgi:hypothetical protein